MLRVVVDVVLVRAEGCAMGCVYTRAFSLVVGVQNGQLLCTIYDETRLDIVSCMKIS